MNNTDLKEIGKRIQQKRKQAGLTQEQLAEMMNVSIQMVSNIERGNKAIRIENLINLCRILSVSTDYILIGKENVSDISELTSRISKLENKDVRLIDMIIDFCLNEKQ